jgi:hypothetical protein
MLLKTNDFPALQAGRRGFDPRHPLYLFNKLARTALSSSSAASGARPRHLDHLGIMAETGMGSAPHLNPADWALATLHT